MESPVRRELVGALFFSAEAPSRRSCAPIRPPIRPQFCRRADMNLVDSATAAAKVVSCLGSRKTN